MNSTGILDDYLDELLGEAMVAPPPAVLPPAGAGPGPAIEAVAEREPTWDDLPADVIYETETIAATPSGDSAALEAAFESAAPPTREPTWDDLPAEARATVREAATALLADLPRNAAGQPLADYVRLRVLARRR